MDKVHDRGHLCMTQAARIATQRLSRRGSARYGFFLRSLRLDAAYVWEQVSEFIELVYHDLQYEK